MTINVIESKEELNTIMQEESRFYLMKHSLTCPISASAKSEFDQFSNDSDIPCYMIHLQDSKELSNSIASEFGIHHESPQVLLFKDKEVIWHDSHHSITNSRLKEAVE